jgi:5-formyltetrahydrofolate cyclo-ligase
LSQREHIACYLPFNDEFDSLPVIETIWQAKKYCYLPVLSKSDEKSLCFVRYDYGDALHRNRYGILEPVNLSRVMLPNLLDIVVMPLLAFDVLGHRLGTGGGYYDCTFAFLHDQQDKKPVMVGLGYAAQQVALMPSDPWDIMMAGVVTEDGFISCS